MIIQIIGLPGSGKTTLAKALMGHTDAIHLNADEVRADLNKDLGFTPEDRIEQARRMGALARLLHAQGRVVFAITGEAALSALIAFWETILKISIYYWHERIWNKVRWGRI